jgi:hypothetical protein
MQFRLVESAWASAVFLVSLTRRPIVNNLLPTWMKDLEDLKKTRPSRPHCGSLDLQRTAHTSISLVTRIEWCRRQGAHAHAEPELEGWRAEEEGLRDAILNTDRTYQYRYSPTAVFERYAMGLEDGRALMRLAWVDRHLATSSQ